jgi:dephospho-CoA kinase
MKRVGITGGIGSGKTFVCRIFEIFGIPVYDADAHAKKIMVNDLAVKSQIRDLIGKEAYHRNGKLNRNFISGKIFTDKSLLKGINDIVHPAVYNDSLRWMETYKNEKSVPYILKEAALLVESGAYKALDKLIVVTCPEDIRIRRVMERDGQSYEAVKKKIDNQLPESEKVRFADFEIINDGDKPLLKQIWKIHKQLTNQ